MTVKHVKHRAPIVPLLKMGVTTHSTHGRPDPSWMTVPENGGFDMTPEPNNPKSARPGHYRRSSRRKPRGLGVLEYALLALIVVCVTITVVIAIVNPGG